MPVPPASREVSVAVASGAQQPCALVVPSQKSGAKSCGDLQIEQQAKLRPFEQLCDELKNQAPMKQINLPSQNLNRMNICFLIEGESDGKELNRQRDWSRRSKSTE